MTFMGRGAMPGTIQAGVGPRPPMILLGGLCLMETQVPTCSQPKNQGEQP